MSLFIDLDCIKENVKKIIDYTNKDLMAVLKNDAYGLGSSKILEVLFSEDIKWIVYNTYNEYLKDKGVIVKYNLRVLILESPTRNALNDEYENIYYSVNDIKDLRLLKKVSKKCFVHLRINSGMNRLGLKTLSECKKIIKELNDIKNIVIDGIYTHFASNENEYEYYKFQSEKFKKYLKLYSFNHIHSASTSSLHKNIIGNMVRVGLGLYGYGNTHLNLSPSITLTSEVIASFKIKKGEQIGYNMTYTAFSKQFVNTIPLGYYDIQGIDHIYYNGVLYPLRGKICMNHAFFITSFKINKISKLIVLSKNDIIKEKYNWYVIITSLNKLPKNYLKRGNHDLSRVYQLSKNAYQANQFRRRGHKTFSSRTFRIRWR